MPEGNELHHYAKVHGEALAGHRVSVDSPNGRFPDSDALNHHKLRSVEAVGKHLGYIFGRDLILHIHLGMFGHFEQGEMPLPDGKGKRWLRIWTKSNWIELHGATDCSLFDHDDWQSLLDRLGPDPLDPDADPTPAFEVMEQRDTPITKLLLDQSIIAGVGNVYRAELLYRARIHPRRPGRELSRKEFKALWRDARKMMRNGVSDLRIVTTRPKDRPHTRGPIHDDEVHYVYRRDGQPCFHCGTKIKKDDIGRTTYWCPSCQKS